MKRFAARGMAGILFLLVMSAIQVQAAPIITFSTTPDGAGNYLLDFSVANTLGVDDLDIYYVGVNVIGGVNVGTPSGWSSMAGTPSFSERWLDYGTSVADMIQNGETLGGFTVRVATVPTSVQWLAYAYDWTNAVGSQVIYPYSDFTRGSSSNPGFAGTATNAVPEPSTLLMLGAGLLGLAGLNRRRKA